ncbi:MAG: hypothetical protein K2I47_02170 [Odoribacter sp.]|nr:hypothetical protein [Odoribacter sp.]
MRKIVAFVFLASLFGGVAKAQTVESKYGIDSVKTIEHTSVYQEFVKQKNYKDALPSWWYVFQNAPKFQLNTYVKGEDIMINMYAQTKNKAYIDTLMMVYDQWMKYFKDHPRYGEGYVIGKKGFNLHRFTIGDEARTKEAFGYLNKSFEMQGSQTHPNTVKMLFAVADDLLKKDQITKDEYIQLFLKVTEYAENGKAHAKKPEQYEDVKMTTDALFFNAGVADCATLNSFLAPKFEKEPGNIDVLKEIARFLKRSECTDLPLFTNVAEALYKVEPSAESAYNLAVMFLKRQEYDKTEAYLKEAIEKGTDPLDKAEYYLRMAQISLSKKQFAESKKHAVEALKLNPNLGAAYLNIGKAYAFASKSYGEDDFDHASVFWVAVDKFNKAKQVDPALADEANGLIKTYSQYFPSKDEAFFRSVQPGDSFKVGGWINETTTARFR